jgi:hypothetical protein
MFCRKCGAQNADNAWKCIQCGETLFTPGQGKAPGEAVKIKNYLVESILVTLFCCLPLGIVAIINAARVNTKLGQGDVAGAQQAAANAKKFCLIGLIGGLIVNITYLVLVFTGTIQP